eukprot:13492245-Alexandrium_andersonii.AAC.1
MIERWEWLLPEQVKPFLYRSNNATASQVNCRSGPVRLAREGANRSIDNWIVRPLPPWKARRS